MFTSRNTCQQEPQQERTRGHPPGLPKIFFWKQDKVNEGSPGTRGMFCVESFLGITSLSHFIFTGDEDKENGDISLEICQVNDSVSSQGNQTPSLLIIQEESCSRPEEGGVSLENPVSSRRASLGTSRSQERSLKEPSYQGVLMEMGPASVSKPDQVTPEPVPTHQGNAGNSTCRRHQEGFHRAQKSYQCEKCPKIFRYFSRLKVHQRRHNNERTVICAECDKGFFQASDLHVHQKIHAGEKPFRCSTCTMSFSHRTNLLAHERIHTGEKPYVCSLCQRRYRQSSTYHRHLRTHQKIAFRSVSPTPEASSM